MEAFPSNKFILKAIDIIGKKYCAVNDDNTRV